jgi:hypothetical protein
VTVEQPPLVTFDAEILGEAFPSSVRWPAQTATRNLLRRVNTGYQSYRFVVRVEGEAVFLPARILLYPGFWPERTESSPTRELGLCLSTRSTNGFDRQAALRAILPVNKAWSIPFVIALVGEYVVELLDDIHAALPDLDRAIVGHFLRENPDFHRLTRARVESYWDVYYRARFRRAGYVGFKLLDAFDAMASEQG